MSGDVAPGDVDHLVYAVPDYEEGVRRVEELLGATAVVGGRHEGRGTRNALIRIGPESYLEIIGVDPTQPDPNRPRWFGLDALDRPRLVTWCARHPDPAAAADLVRGLGMELGAVESGSRRRSDGSELRWSFTDPRAERAGGVIPFLIDWGATRHPSRDLHERCTLARLELRHPDAASLGTVLEAIVPGAALVVGPEPGLTAVVSCPRGQVTLA